MGDLVTSEWMMAGGSGGWIEADPGYRSCPRLGAAEDSLSESEVRKIITLIS